MSFNYHCFNNKDRACCELCDHNGDFSLVDRDEELFCPHAMVRVKVMGENMSGCITGKLTSAQIQREKKARSHKDFVNNVLPSISDADARKHHLKKLGKSS